jgi:hypothetical protein
MADNTQDMIKRGRSRLKRGCPSGEANPAAKLTREQVNAIREVWRTSPTTKRALAKAFGVTDVLIGKILRLEIWK